METERVSDKTDKILAGMSQPQTVVFDVPLKLAVAMIAFTESDNTLSPVYGSHINKMKKQIATQLSKTGE